MAVSIDRAKRGTGSIRERLPGVWEIRVVVGFDRIHSRSVQRSFTVHGDKEAAEQRRRELVDDFGISRAAFASEASRMTVAELLERFFAAPHLWKPATVASHKHVIRALVEDSLGRRRLVSLTPSDVRAAICRWQSAGQSVSTVSSRWLVLRSALSWAVSEGVLRSNPLAGMRGPARPEPRRHHTLSEVRQILRSAGDSVEMATHALDPPRSPRLLPKASERRAICVDEVGSPVGPPPGLSVGTARCKSPRGIDRDGQPARDSCRLIAAALPQGAEGRPSTTVTVGDRTAVRPAGDGLCLEIDAEEVLGEQPVALRTGGHFAMSEKPFPPGRRA